MKKRIIAIGLMLVMTFGVSNVVFAADNIPAVKYTKDKELKFFENAQGTVAMDSISMDEFDGMAPGDTRTQTIQLVNEGDRTTDFYVSQEAFALEENSQEASDGAYSYKLSVGTQNDESKATAIIDSKVGGSGEDSENGKKGLNGLDENVKTLVDNDNSYIFLATIEPGESAYIFLTLTLDGGSHTNLTSGSRNYTDAAGNIQLQFYAQEQSIRTVVTNVTQYVQTGDNAMYLIFGGVLVVGVALVIVAMRRKKKENA